MSAPQFDVAQPHQPTAKPIRGWVAFFLVIGILTLQQFGSYMDRGSEAEAPSISSLDGRLKTIMRGAALESAVYAMGRQPSPQAKAKREAARSATRKELLRLASDIQPFRTTEASYELLYAIVRHEAGEKVAAETIDALSKESGPRRRAAARIYGSQALTASQLESLTRPFSGEFFADEVVKIHAHEKAGDMAFRSTQLRKGAVGLAIAASLLVAAGAIGCVLLLAFAGARMAGKCKPMGFPSGTLTFAQADANAMRTALMLVALFGGQIVVLLLFNGMNIPREAKSVASFALSLACAVWVLRTPIHGHRVSARQLGFRKERWLADSLWGIGAAMANLPIVLVAALIGNAVFSWLPPAHHPIQDELTRSATSSTIVLLFIGAAVFAPVFEEVAFRGTLLPALSRRFGGPAAGIALCGLFFAMIHPTGVPAWLPLAAVGSMAAFVTYQRQSLVPAIAMHAVHNAGILTFSLMALS